jgi:undecaprenyl-diphosphatase
MRDPEVERAAEFLATHAILLLGLGIVAALVSLSAIVLAVRTVAKFRHPLLREFASLLNRAQDGGALSRIIVRESSLIPSGYVALHLGLGLALTAAASAFVVVAEEIATGGEIAAFDTAFARALSKAITPEWKRFFIAISWFGSREVLATVAGVVAVGLLLRGRRVLAFGWVAAQAGGGLLNMTLKEAFERSRPELADPLLVPASWSFPSGHAMGTFILCGLGSYLLVRQLRSWTAASVLVTIALLWCVVVSFSRLYLGVHFASDVIAGLFVGAGWVAVCISAFEAVGERRRQSAVDVMGRAGRRSQNV